MEIELADALQQVGYEGQLCDPNVLRQVVGDEKINQDFRNLISWITEEIAGLGQLDERISKDDDLNTFFLELSAFLKEIQCPHSEMMSGPVSSRLQTIESRFLLLDYLVSELMAQKMATSIKGQTVKTDLAITLHETPTAAALKDIAMTLNLGRPPDNITPKMLFEKINTKLDEVLKNNNGMKRIGKPLFNPATRMSDENWAKLTSLEKELDEEYELRRKMLLTRLECTVQSFSWSERIKGKEGEIAERYASKKSQLDKITTGNKRADIPSLLAARENLAIIEKTSSANVRKNTKSKIQRHIIGRVPDRGGRAYEHAPPPKEMPSWQTQRAGGPQGGGGGRGGYQGGRGGHGGGQRGNFNNHNSGYQNSGASGGGYQNNRNQGNYNDNRNQGGSRVQGGWSQRGNHSGPGGYDNRNQGGYDNRNQGNYDNRSQGGYDNRSQGGYDNRSQGGYDNRSQGSGGYDRGYDNRGGHQRDDYNRDNNQQRGRSNYNCGGRR